MPKTGLTRTLRSQRKILLCHATREDLNQVTTQLDSPKGPRWPEWDREIREQMHQLLQNCMLHNSIQRNEAISHEKQSAECTHRSRWRQACGSNSSNCSSLRFAGTSKPECKQRCSPKLQYDWRGKGDMHNHHWEDVMKLWLEPCERSVGSRQRRTRRRAAQSERNQSN